VPFFFFLLLALYHVAALASIAGSKSLEIFELISLKLPSQAQNVPGCRCYSGAECISNMSVGVKSSRHVSNLPKKFIEIRKTA